MFYPSRLRIGWIVRVPAASGPLFIAFLAFCDDILAALSGVKWEGCAASGAICAAAAADSVSGGGLHGYWGAAASAGDVRLQLPRNRSCTVTSTIHNAMGATNRIRS